MADPIEPPRIFSKGDAFRQYPYVIEEFLGAGTFGQVYSAYHRFKAKLFALKVSHLADHKQIRHVARSLVEAQATYCIRHENIVRVFDLGCEDDGLVWMVMELLDGYSLGALLHRCGRFSPMYAIDIVIEAAWGLQAAHELHIVHRDVQPSNVFVTAKGRVKVLDFSLAKWVRSPLKTTHGRRPHGTAGYMSPEHIRGKTEPNPQFDVYALGILLWQMLTGRHPYEECLGNAALMVERQLTAEPESLVTAAGLPAYCDDVVRGAIAKDPRARYAGMWPLTHALTALRERLLADGSLEMPVQPWERQVPIVHGAGVARYQAPRAPRPAPGAAPARTVPLARIVVAGAPPEGDAARPAESAGRARTVAATVPMEAVSEPMVAPEAPINRTPTALAAPATLRPGRSASPARWIWAVVGAIVSIGVGVVLWVVVGPAPMGTAAAPAPAAPPPRASASASASSGVPPRPSSSPAERHRGAPARSKH